MSTVTTPPSATRERLIFHAPPELADALRALARHHERSVSAELRFIVSEYVRRHRPADAD